MTNMANRVYKKSQIPFPRYQACWQLSKDQLRFGDLRDSYPNVYFYLSPCGTCIVQVTEDECDEMEKAGYEDITIAFN